MNIFKTIHGNLKVCLAVWVFGAALITYDHMCWWAGFKAAQRGQPDTIVSSATFEVPEGMTEADMTYAVNLYRTFISRLNTITKRN